MFFKKIFSYATTHFPAIWAIINRCELISKFFNRIAINQLVNVTEPRPYPHSLRSDHTTWPSLTERNFTGRHLPVADQSYINNLPNIADVVRLFERPAGTDGAFCQRSNVLFPSFAQWFTDGFLRTDPNDPRKNTSNQEIDLCQIYGLKEATTDKLRSKTGGRLKSQITNNEEYPPYAYDPYNQIKPEFSGLSYLPPPSSPLMQAVKTRQQKLFAMGTDRSNSTPGYVALNTLFLREHNRICGELSRQNPQWDDERLFQSARNILIAVLIKIVVEDYINHISSSYFDFKADPGFAFKQDWYRTNWFTLEFNLLYRWHSLFPNELIINKSHLGFSDFMYNTDLVVTNGLANCFESFCQQRACQIGLFNTTPFLYGIEMKNLDYGRMHRLRSYNEYRRCFGFDPVNSFTEISSSEKIQTELKNLYGNPDNVELYVGLYAEDREYRAIMGPLMTAMVAVDAFSQALTNPLLSKNVFNAKTFSEVGLHVIAETKSLDCIIRRNVAPPPSYRFSFEY